MGVSNSAVARVTGIDVQPKNFDNGNAAMLPQRLLIIGQGNDDVLYSTDKYECDGSAASVAERYGYGSPLHLAAKQLFPTAGAMATFPVSIIAVKKGANGFVAASGAITVAGENATAAAACVLDIGGLDVQIAVAKGDTAAQVAANIAEAVNAEQDRPVVAEAEEATVTLTARWSGALGNRISLSWSGDAPGLTFALTAFADGAGVPSVDAALASVGEVWETFVLDTFDYKTADGNASPLLDVYQTWGEGRWSVLEKKGCLVAHGCTDDYVTRTAVTDSRPSDRINFLIESVGSPELPFVVGARGLLNILTTADSNPAQGYKGTLGGLKRGTEAQQEGYPVRNQSVMKGASTNVVSGSVAALEDIITMYHPAGGGKHPAWRYVVNCVKLMNVVFNLRLLTESDEVKAAPLMPDKQVTSNPAALQPKTFRTWFANLAASLADNAIIGDAEFTVKNLKVSINQENSNRIDYVYPVKVSGNVEIVSGDVYFSQYLG